MFNKETIGKMKKGSFLVNNARGAICDPPAVVEALKSGQLRGELIDSWFSRIDNCMSYCS